MDLQLMMFPFIMAVLTNSLMILVMFLLRKSKYFANIYGVGLILTLYVLCILRMFLPLEFPGIQVIIRDNVVYSGIIAFLRGRTELTRNLPFDILTVLLIIWLAVSLVLLLLFILRQRRDNKRIKASPNLATEEEQKLLDTVAAEVLGPNRKVMFKKTTLVAESMVTGYRSPAILIPDIEYDQDELRMILQHECVHIKDKDMWIKLLLRLYRIIFWWNPFAYLLCVGVDDTLESKCDWNVVKHFGVADKYKYANTVAKFMAEEEDKNAPTVKARFSKHVDNQAAKLRITTILSKKPSRKRQIAMTAIVSILFIGIFVASYIFIWQSFYGYEATDDKYELADDGIISDDTNSYLIKQDDGSYLFYFAGVPQEKVTAEDVEQGLYDDFPILEN